MPKGTCSVEHCAGVVMCRGWCNPHYQSWYRYADPLHANREGRSVCTVDGCETVGWRGNRMCGMHYQRWRKFGDPAAVKVRRVPAGTSCSVPGCTRAYRSLGYCQLHYRRLTHHGDPLAEVAVKDGSGYLNSQGYRVLYRPDHPASDRNGSVLEHRMVMADLLGRPLLPEETVHHVNGVRDDNGPTNLELWSSSHPSGQRVADKVTWAQEILRLYAAVA